MANNGFAIVLQDGATDNTFYGNTFTADSCKIQIDDGVEDTRWDNGTIGNYWGDYNGTDSNGDGIGDTPYIVNGHKWDQEVEGFKLRFWQDSYPLIEPIDTSKYCYRNIRPFHLCRLRKLRQVHHKSNFTYIEPYINTKSKPIPVAYCSRVQFGYL